MCCTYGEKEHRSIGSNHMGGNNGKMDDGANKIGNNDVTQKFEDLRSQVVNILNAGEKCLLEIFFGTTSMSRNATKWKIRFSKEN